VVNKVDQLDAGEVSQVKHFIEKVIEEATGRQPRLYFTDARSAVRGLAGVDFAALVADLEEFVDTGLIAALNGVAERDLASIGSSLRGSVALERAALDMDQAKLARLSVLFGEEASRQRALRISTRDSTRQPTSAYKTVTATRRWRSGCERRSRKAFGRPSTLPGPKCSETPRLSGER
jgi:hypothetical protein